MLVDLIAKLEAVDGPRYVLEEAIFEVTRGRKRERSTFEQYQRSERLPKYMSSLDDATGLLRGLWCLYNMEEPGCKYVPANADGSYTGAREINVNHGNVCIAVCIAALKALTPSSQIPRSPYDAQL